MLRNTISVILLDNKGGIIYRMVVVMVIFSLTIIILGFLAVKFRKNREKELSEEWRGKLLKMEYLYVIAMLALFSLMVIVGSLRVLDVGGSPLIVLAIFGTLMFSIVGTIVGLVKQMLKISKEVKVIEVDSDENSIKE